MIRRIHLVTGLILFAYVLTHLVNHALGLVSLDALDAGRRAFLLLWRNPPASVLLYGALLVHMALALWSLYRRRRLAMPAWEAAQILFGLAIPPLLALHVLGTRFAHDVLGVNDNYVYLLLIYFVFSPVLGMKQVAALVVAWVHGCIGLHFWLRLRPWYPRALPYLYAAALLVPVLSLLGFFVAGREVIRLAQDPSWMETARGEINFTDAQGLALIAGLETAILTGLGALLAFVLLARWARAWLNRRRGIVHVAYPDGRRVPIAVGTTILEASRGAGIPHASVCGGRGRCSTCRVRVGAGAGRLPPPSEAEARVLRRVGAAPNVRLACQTRPAADVEVTPLLPPAATPRDAAARQRQGEEREVAVLFADLRDFTALAENRLPFDVVFVLNRYFAAMGMAVEESGGRVDKFVGDGVMALFGTEQGVEAGCRDAIRAARRMAERLIEINGALAHELERPLRIGIGIHSGSAIVGEMGYGRATSVTVIGDVVNTASRLEALTKDLGAQLVVSEPAARHANLDLSAFPQREIEVRGRETALAVRVVKNAQALPVAPDAGPRVTADAAKLSRPPSPGRP
ncbi:MAG: adenylate/guanylate cyclase domain-containing protein [Kiloniellaceae bacterium]